MHSLHRYIIKTDLLSSRNVVNTVSDHRLSLIRVFAGRIGLKFVRIFRACMLLLINGPGTFMLLITSPFLPPDRVTFVFVFTMSYPSPSTCPPQRVSIFLLLVNILLGLGVVGSPIPVDTPQRDYTFIHYQPPNSAPAPAPAPASASAPAPAPVAGFVHHLPPSDPASTVAGFVHREPPSAPAPAVAGFIHYVPPSAPAIAPAPASGKDYYDHPHWYSDLLVQEHELMIRPLRYSGDTENLEARDAPIQANQQLGLLVGNWILRYKLLNSDGSLPAPREAMTLDGRLYQDDPQFREYLTRSGTQRNAQPKGSDVIAYFGDKGLAGVLTDLQNPSKFHFAIDDGRPWRPGSRNRLCQNRL
ncbi:hypothetical protein F5880DRAFT_247908 [Lentinula raphanica]|nr:hypothetical protein F5880DRAFT_247908 [Lentinula raphanica]